MIEPSSTIGMAFGIAAAVVSVVFVGGCLYFRKSEDEFADVI